jgi:hypothetical protein
MWKNRLYISSGDLEGYSLFPVYKATVFVLTHFAVVGVLWIGGADVGRNSALRLFSLDDFMVMLLTYVLRLRLVLFMLLFAVCFV